MIQAKRLLLSGAFFFLFVLAYGQRTANSGVDLSTPYNTVRTHLFYLQPDTYQPDLAARALYGVPDSARRVTLAIQLKQILDGKGLYVHLNRLPRDQDYLDSVTNQQVFTLFPEKLPVVYLEKTGDNWYYSEETVANIPDLHSSIYPFGVDILVNIFPSFGQNKFLGLRVWQWIGILLVFLAAFLIHQVLWRIIIPLMRRLASFRKAPLYVKPQIIGRIARYISLILIIQLVKLFIPSLQFQVELSTIVITVLRLLTTLFVVLTGLQIVNIFTHFLSQRTLQTESKLDEQLVPIVESILQVLVVAAGVIQALNILGVNITALIAGISVGAVAIGLAAKDTVANVFGSLVIFLDRPFQIGDWINYGGIDGTVEQVGIRATRVRTFANSLVYIPNGVLTNATVNNYGLRVFRRFKTTVSVTYDTPPVLIEKFIEGMREIVVNHPNTRKDYFEIHLNDFGPSSLNILFYIFFAVPSWSEELKGRHEVMLAVIRLAEELGVRFAFPTSTIHIEEMPGQVGLQPTYTTDPEKVDEKLQRFLSGYKQRVKGDNHAGQEHMRSGKGGESGESGE